MENENSSRRRFVRKLVSLAALGGITGLLLGRETEKVSAAGAANQIAYYTAPDILTGSDNLRWDNANRNFIAGHSSNTVTSGVVGATISGGGATYNINRVTDNYGTVGGGISNQAGDNAGTTGDRPFATVGGGLINTASGESATVGGGGGNTASGQNATVGGGGGNVASGYYATVGGGAVNTASNSFATVGGGYHNAAGGDRATVGGGSESIAAGDYSFAAGRRAKIDAAHGGSFLFSDSSNFDFNSSAANEFAVRATGGARIVTAIDGTGSPSKSVVITPAGNIGIGTSTPAANIHSESTSADPAIKGRNTGTGDGIQGESSSGYGVRGYASGTSGIGVEAENEADGVALRVSNGRCQFSTIIDGTIPAGSDSATVTDPRVGTNSEVMVMLMSDPGTAAPHGPLSRIRNSVSWVNIAAGSFTVYLLGPAAVAVPFRAYIAEKA